MVNSLSKEVEMKKTKRAIVPLNEEDHTNLKMLCVSENICIQEFCVDAINRELLRRKVGFKITTAVENKVRN